MFQSSNDIAEIPVMFTMPEDIFGYLSYYVTYNAFRSWRATCKAAMWCIDSHTYTVLSNDGTPDDPRVRITTVGPFRQEFAWDHLEELVRHDSTDVVLIDIWGYLEVWAWPHEPLPKWDAWCSEIFRHQSNMDVVMTAYTLENGPGSYSDAIEWAEYNQGCHFAIGDDAYRITRGLDGLLEILYNHEFPWLYEVSLSAASSGQLKVLEWVLWNGGADPDHKIALAAALGGHRHILEHIFDYYSMYLDEDLVVAAATSGSIPTLEYLWDLECPAEYFEAATATLLELGVGIGLGRDISQDRAHPHSRAHVLEWLREREILQPALDQESAH